MKLWKKVFLVVFLLFVVSFTLGGYYVINATYGTSLETQIEAIISEACYVGDEINTDLSNVAKINALNDSNLQGCLWTYGTELRKRDVYILYEAKGKLKYNSNTNLPSANLDWDLGEEYKVLDKTVQVIVFQEKKINYVAVRNDFVGILNGHRMIYVYSIENFEKQWSKMRVLMPIVECAILILVGVALAMVLIRLTRPINHLSTAAKDVAQGESWNRVEVKGNDEVAQLAENFNYMIDQIETSMNELERSSREKQRFIDNLGHELRTPLTSITGYAEYLKMAQVSEEDRMRALGYITSEGHRLQKLSNTLLDLALLREDEIELKELAVADLLEIMEIGFQQKFQKRKLHFTTCTELTYLYGNFELLCSLMVNLIENASRACKEGGNVELSITYQDKTRDVICIRVKDDGIGIQKKDIDKVSEPFYRVDKARSRDMGGVGLGVTLCQQIVKAHKGKMYYESEEGKGTCVTVLLNAKC